MDKLAMITPFGLALRASACGNRTEARHPAARDDARVDLVEKKRRALYHLYPVETMG
jgi:hypothetical protein